MEQRSRAVVRRLSLPKSAEPGEPVLAFEETGRAVMAALDDMQRQAVDVDACAAGHDASGAEIEPGRFSRPAGSPNPRRRGGYRGVSGVRVPCGY
jgi:hypothetical protein